MLAHFHHFLDNSRLLCSSSSCEVVFVLISKEQDLNLKKMDVSFVFVTDEKPTRKQPSLAFQIWAKYVSILFVILSAKIVLFLTKRLPLLEILTCLRCAIALSFTRGLSPSLRSFFSPQWAPNLFSHGA
jgi:hypothetical protein